MWWVVCQYLFGLNVHPHLLDWWDTKIWSSWKKLKFQHCNQKYNNKSNNSNFLRNKTIVVYNRSFSQQHKEAWTKIWTDKNALQSTNQGMICSVNWEMSNLLDRVSLIFFVITQGRLPGITKSYLFGCNCVGKREQVVNHILLHVGLSMWLNITGATPQLIAAVELDQHLKQQFLH